MARYEINGGNPLVGTVTISGAKNAAVAICQLRCWSEESAALKTYLIYRMSGSFWTSWRVWE